MTIKMIADYACPFCYLDYNYLISILPEFPEIEISLELCEAHPHPEPRYTIKENSSWWEKNMKAVASYNGIEIDYPLSPVPRSDLAIQGNIYLKNHNFDTSSYDYKIYRAIFADKKDIENIDVITEAMSDYNIDQMDLRRVLTSRELQPAQLELNNQAYMIDKVEVLPTFIYGDKRLGAGLGVGLTKQEIVDFFKAISDKR